MIQRRDFLKQSALLTAGAMIHPSFVRPGKTNVGLGLFTLRAELNADPKAALTKVAQLGYSDVETFGYNGKYFNLTPAEFSALLKSLKLRTTSGHYYPAGFFLNEGWEEKWKTTLQDAAKVGQEYIVVPWMEENYRGALDTYTKLAEQLNKASVHAKQAGLTLAYHNHDFEFADLEGKNGFETLLKNTDPAVNFEMDIYWVKKAGKDPLELFKAYPGRFPLWHVKDMDNTDKQFFTEVGSGVIDFKTIFANARLAGMKHFYVEQDVSPGSPFDSIQKSIGYLQKNIIK